MLSSAFVEILSEYRSRTTFSCDSSEKSSWSSRKLKSSRIDSWVKLQLYRSAYIYTFIYIDDNRTLKWDTMCMKLYCSPESVGQFGPSADQAIVRHTYHHQMHRHRLQEFLGECIPRIHSNLLRQIKSFEAYVSSKSRLLFIEQSDLLVV